MISRLALMRWYWGRVVIDPQLEPEAADAYQDSYLRSYALETR